MRPVQLMTRPIAEPYVCIKCGSGSSREHYVDLGVDSELHRVDDFGTKHISTGVIYFCNLCITDLITSYLSKLFKFLSQQTVGRDLAVAQDTSRMQSLIEEISNLHDIINRRDKKILELQDQNNTLRYESVHPTNEKTATQVVAELLGEEDDGTGNSESDSGESISIGIDSDSDGVESNPQDSSGDSNSDNADSEPDSLTTTQFGNSFLARTGSLD